MQIHSLELTDFKGIGHLRLADLPERGVVVVHGNNEAGKSTVLNAIDAVLWEKHSSKKKSIKALKPAGGGAAGAGAGTASSHAGGDRNGGPTVAIEMTVGPYRFTLSKRWLKAPYARLTITAPRPENLTDEDAENRLKEILDEHLDEKLLHTLFLRQGQEFAARIQAAGIPSLSTALDARSGAGEAGGAGSAYAGSDYASSAQTSSAPSSSVQADNDALMQRVEAEYSRYFTQKENKPAKELKSAKADLDAAEAAATEAEAKLRELDSFVARYEDVERQLATTEEKLPAAREELSVRREEAEKARAAAEQAAARRDEYRRALEDLEHAQQAQQQRQNLAVEVEKLTAEADSARNVAAEKQEQAADEESRIAELMAQLDEAKQAHATARQAVRDARAAKDQAADRQELTALDTLLADVALAESNLDSAREAVAACGRIIEDSDVTAVDDAAGEVRVQRALAESAAAKLWVSSTADDEIRVDGKSTPLSADPHPVELREGTTVEIGSVTARYAAGAAAAGSADAGAQLEKAEARLADLLHDLGCTDADEVRARRDEHRELLATRDAAVREWEAVIGAKDVGELRAKQTALRDKLGSDEETVEHQTADAMAAAAEALANAERAEEEAQAAVDNADAALAPRRERPFGRDAAIAQSNVDNVERMLAAKKSEFEHAVAGKSDDELNAWIESARAAADKAGRDVEEAERQVAAADPDMAEKLLVGAQAQLETLDKRRSDAEAERYRLTGYIEQAAGAAETVEIAQADRQAAADTYAAVNRRAQAAKRLRDLLVTHRDAARRRYAEPFATKLGALASSVFGGDVSFTLDADLAIEQRVHDGVAVPLGALSGGAQEQLSILTRFAIADLVADPDSESVPVVVDDALGSTDPQRLQLMSTLFADAGRQSQVLVFTCDPDRFSRVPGRTEIDIESMKLN